MAGGNQNVDGRVMRTSVTVFQDTGSREVQEKCQGVRCHDLIEIHLPGRENHGELHEGTRREVPDEW